MTNYVQSLLMQMNSELAVGLLHKSIVYNTVYTSFFTVGV